MSIAKQIEALDKKIADLTAKRVELVEKQGKEVNVDAFVPNTTIISFTQGKGDKLRTVVGAKFLGVKKAEKGGTVVKVLVGEGASAEIVGLFPSQITSVA